MGGGRAVEEEGYGVDCRWGIGRHGGRYRKGHLPGMFAVIKRFVDKWIGEGEKASGPMHVAFVAPSRAAVDAFYSAAIKAGGRDNGAPGLRPHYHANYYGAFVFDLDGNNAEAVCHRPE
mgnify:CR=1 FL=1